MTANATSVTAFIGTGSIMAAFFDDGTVNPTIYEGSVSTSYTDFGKITDKLVYTYTATAVPEPGTLGLFGSALAMLGFFRRRRRRA